MRRFTKTVAIILTLAICLSLSSYALASSPLTEEPLTTATYSEKTWLVSGNRSLSISGEDLENGDQRFTQTIDGIVTSVLYFDRSELQIIRTDYENHCVINQEITNVAPPPVAHSTNATTTRTVNVGDVRYNHYVQGYLGAITRINWSYTEIVTPEVEYNLHGQYQDRVDMLATLISVITMFSASSIIKIIDLVLGAAGLGGSTGEFFIDDYIVICKEQEVIWRASASNKTRTYEGVLYTAVHETVGQTQSSKEGQYYPTTAIADHNTILALKPYNYFFSGHNSVSIHSWPV